MFMKSSLLNRHLLSPLAHHLRRLLILQSSSLFLLCFSLFFVPFRVDLARERVLELKRHKVDKKDLNRQKCSSRSPVEEARPQETHRASPVHRRAGDIERESCYRFVHQDPKVVAEEGAGKA